MNRIFKTEPVKTQIIRGFCYFILAIFLTSVHANSLKCLQNQLSDAQDFARAALTKIDTNTSLDSLSDIYTSLRETTDNKLIKNLEARRLINQEDWEKAIAQTQEEAWRTYGDQTMNSWFKGREFVLSLPKNQSIDSDLLKTIHKIVSEKHKFHGFEGRRLLHRLRKGEISKEEFETLRKRAFENNEEIAGTPHSSLTGRYRSDSIDQVEHRGSSFTKNGSRYFTKNELEELQKNKYVTVNEASIKQTGENSYTGVAYYLDVEKITPAVKDILKSSQKKLKDAKTPRDIVEIVVQMEKDLISVHPFLDGNGRSIRLLGDYVLRVYDLPPSLYPNESDLTMSLEEAVDFRIKGMKDYLKEHQKYMKEARNKRARAE